MKFMRLAACAVAFAVVGGMAVAEDMDIKALQAKLAAQEARLNDLQAKMGSGAAEAPASIMSLKKNAKVTIGGDLDFRYVYDNYEKTDESAGGTRLWDVDKADAFVDTADLRIGVEVNEHFDAFMRISGHDNADRSTGIVRDAWVRWKNICNSGWGILVGRDSLKFGMGKPIGMWDAWIQDDASRSGAMQTLPHLNYGVSRTTQINPYWESCDGKFRFDLSIFQNLDARNSEGGTAVIAQDGDRTTVNYGLGSGTMKLTWKPTEDWTFVAAVAHLYADGENGNMINAYLNGKGGAEKGGRYGQTQWNDDVNSQSNTALHLGFIYNPAAFCKKLTLWAQATQEFNTAFVKDQDFFGTNFGASYAFTDKFTAFAQGDYVKGDIEANGTHEIEGYRAWVGGVYNMGNGVALEAGYSYEDLEKKHSVGNVHRTDDEVTGSTLYTRLTFAF